MLKALPSGTKKILFGVILPALILTAGLSSVRFFSLLDRGLYDLLLRIKVARYPVEPNPRVVPVDLNDASVNELEEAVDSRRAFADLLQVLADCSSTVVLDFIFKNPLAGREALPAGVPAAGDAELIRAAAGVQRLVLAVIPVPEKLANISHGGLDEHSRKILSKNLWHIREMGAGALPAARTF
ncbi:MAG: CHASE2 domain-containing protein, partial [Spirochaetaceae bacterium]|nr:CHASE2 domain-containing protein [Spirochaetaceae bacterium]